MSKCKQCLVLLKLQAKGGKACLKLAWRALEMIQPCKTGQRSECSSKQTLELVKALFQPGHLCSAHPASPNTAAGHRHFSESHGGFPDFSTRHSIKNSENVKSLGLLQTGNENTVFQSLRNRLLCL